MARVRFAIICVFHSLACVCGKHHRHWHTTLPPRYTASYPAWAKHAPSADDYNHDVRVQEDAGVPCMER